MTMSVLRTTTLRSSAACVRSFSSSALRSEVAKSAIELSLRNGLKAAMKAKDKPTMACIKTILADITTAAKLGPNPNDPASESAVISAIRKGIKDRDAAAESYAPSSPSAHPESYSNLQNEISVLKSYLPESPSIESITSTVKEIIASLEESAKASKGVQGVVMKSLWEKLGSAAAAVDKKEVGKVVAELLKK